MSLLTSSCGTPRAAAAGRMHAPFSPLSRSGAGGAAAGWCSAFRGAVFGDCINPASPLAARRGAEGPCFSGRLPSNPAAAAAAGTPRGGARASSLCCRATWSNFDNPGSPVHGNGNTNDNHIQFGGSGSNVPPRLASASAALFSQAEDALEGGRWSEAAAVLEDALDTQRGFARLPLPPQWTTLRLQVVFLEALLHAGHYSRCAARAAALLAAGGDAAPQPRDWCRVLWVQGVALALMGRRAAASDCLVRAFMEGVVPLELRGAMRASFAAAGAFDGDNVGDDDPLPGASAAPCSPLAAGPGPGSPGQRYHHHNAVPGHDDWDAPRDLPGFEHHPDATAAYPWLSTDPSPEHLFAPLDSALDGSCSIHKEWYTNGGGSSSSSGGGGGGGHAHGSSSGEGRLSGGAFGACMEGEEGDEGVDQMWSRAQLANFMLWGDPDGV